MSTGYVLTIFNIFVQTNADVNKDVAATEVLRRAMKPYDIVRPAEMEIFRYRMGSRSQSKTSICCKGLFFLFRVDWRNITTK